jgi:hypothetical protein
MSSVPALRVCIRRFAPVALVLLAGCAGGGSPTSPTTAAPTFQLSGSIRDASAGILLPGISVSIADGVNAGKSSVTGADGRFALVGLLSDSATLRTQNSSYEDHLQDVRITQHTVLDIRLTPKRSVSSGWTQGQLYFTANGARAGNRATNPQVTQTGTTVTGTFNTAEGGSATFTGRLEGTRFTGTIRAEVAFGAPLQRCRGLAPIAAGTVTPDFVALTAETMAFENCAGAATNIELSIQP